MERRSFISTLMAATALGLVGVPRVRAASGARRRFVFVVARGGWDPLLTLLPRFDVPAFDLPVQTTTATVHGIAFGDSALRPSVRQFIELHGPRMLVWHGVAVRSVAHDICETTMLTGSATGGDPDFATRLATESDATLPHLVLEGPSLPGVLAPLVTRAGRSGELQGLLDGTLPPRGAGAAGRLRRPTLALVDDFRARRLAAFADAGSRLGAEALRGHERKLQIEGLRGDVSFATDGSFDAQVNLAVRALAADVAQCVTISPPFSWDTHTDSDNRQTGLWEGLFEGLLGLMRGLETTAAPGELESRMLADETVVVVVSEMARTPKLNADAGRDHWPWTSLFIVGPGVTGGRVVGAHDGNHAGVGVDPQTGELDAGRAATSPAEVGATLLALAGMDPGVLGATPVVGVLA